MWRCLAFAYLCELGYTFYPALVHRVSTNWQTLRHHIFRIYLSITPNTLWNPLLKYESSSGPTALGLPFLKASLKGPHGKLLSTLSFILGRCFLRLSLALREISVLLMLQPCGSWDFCEGEHPCWDQAESLTLTSPTLWHLPLRPPFFTLDTSPFQMHPPLHSEITFCSDSLFSRSDVICDLYLLCVGQTVYLGLWGLWHKPNVRSPLPQHGDCLSLPF